MASTPKSVPVHEHALHPAQSQEEYALHLAALEWSLAESIVIHSAEDIQSRANWRGRLEPFEHQVQNLFTFCRRLPVALLADDVGLGKTISAGLILSELMVRRRVRRALVLCPKILCPQWVEELDAKFGITAKVAVGGDLKSELNRQTPVVVTTYESAKSHLKGIKLDAFDMLVLDEAHKLKNLHGGNAPPALAVSVRAALEQRLFKYVVMLTATPIHNRLWDLYSLLDCLTVAKGHKHPLGTPDEFKETFLDGGKGRMLNPVNAEAFRGILRQYLVRTRRGDARLKFPTREVRILRVNASPQERQVLGLVAKHIDNLNPFQQLSLAQALMSSPQALACQLENMARTGSVGQAAATEARALADRITRPAKLSRLAVFLKELKASRPDWRAVVFTLRKETQTLIGDALKRDGIPVGFIQGGQHRQNQVAIASFHASPPGVRVLVSTDAGAEGINLQVANVLVNYDLPWNPMVVEQRIGRVQRLGSKHEHVVIGNLVVTGSVEEQVVSCLMGKLQAIAHAIGDIESILETTDPDGKGPEDQRFEDQIRELVVKSLLGQDVAQATRLKEESIERAKRQIEERRQELDGTLGHLDDLHHTGPRMPRLSRLTPGMPAREFVLRAKKADGVTVEPRPDGAYQASQSGRPAELIAFEEAVADALAGRAVFMGNVSLYLPGRPAFEKLVQHWVDDCGHLVHDLTPRSAKLAEDFARSWCQTVPGAVLQGCQVVSAEKKFQGRVRAKVRAGNGVDSYEKLISGKFHPEGHVPLPASDSMAGLIDRDLLPSQVLPDFTDAIAQSVQADRDVGEFCRFYEARRLEELGKAGDDPRRRHKITSDLTPAVAAEIVGVQGTHYEEVRLTVRFTLDGKGPYEVSLQAVPASGQVLREPPRATCQETGREVPEPCLARCEVSHRRVLKHLLEASEVSRRQALPQYLATCDVTGKPALKDELGTSDVTGRVVLTSLLRKSFHTGRRGLPEEFVRCEITGQEGLRDEAVLSDVSAKLFLKAEAARSAVSGAVGHWSEFVRCEQTGDTILPSESGKSAVSGKVVRKDLLSPSAKPPGRLGLAAEFGICARTGRRLLSDELERSAVSGAWFDRELLHRSDRSGQLALEEELVRCEEAGARLLPSETGVCTVTRKTVDTRLLAKSQVSGVVALATLMRACAETGNRALPSELKQCDLTKGWVLPGLLRTCAVTGRQAIARKMLTCQQTGAKVLPSEVGKSDLSGKVVRKDLLSASDKPPGRLGLEDELRLCEVTGKRFLLDELGQSAVSGKWVDRDLLRPSARSGLLALAEELVVCEDSGLPLLPSEIGTCSLTGRRVDSRLLARSVVSGAVALKRLLARCASTNTLALPSELEECQLTHVRILPEKLGTCAVTGTRALRHLLVTCQQTGAVILPSEAGVSAVSGKFVRKSLLLTSQKPPGRLGLKDEVGACAVTGKQLLLDEMGRSQVSGKLVDRDLLQPSALSGKRALESELGTCEMTGALLLPEEIGFCHATKKRVDARLLAQSEVSGVTAIESELVRCAKTRRLALPSELEQCRVTGLQVLPEELETCAVTGERALRGKMVRSDVSGKYALPGSTVRSAVSKIVCLPEEAVRCAWLQRPILKGEAKKCELTGLRVARPLLNENGELKPLADLLDGRAAEARNADYLIPLLLSQEDGAFRGLKHVEVVESPGRDVVAVCGEIRRLLALKTRYAGFLLRNRKPAEILGEYVIGYRSNEGWVLEEA